MDFVFNLNCDIILHLCHLNFHVENMMPKVIAFEVKNFVSAPIMVALLTRETIVEIYMVDHMSSEFPNQTIC